MKINELTKTLLPLSVFLIGYGTIAGLISREAQQDLSRQYPHTTINPEYLSIMKMDMDVFHHPFIFITCAGLMMFTRAILEIYNLKQK